MPRFFPSLLIALLAGGAALAQQQQQQPQEPPEEDESLTATTREYSFNPLQAEKELSIGNFYFKKGSYKAAAMRYEEAAKWNPGYAEAYYKLAETREKLKDDKGAREAYAKFLEVAPEDKRAADVKKKLGK